MSLGDRLIKTLTFLLSKIRQKEGLLRCGGFKPVLWFLFDLCLFGFRDFRWAAEWCVHRDVFGGLWFGLDAGSL